MQFHMLQKQEVFIFLVQKAPLWCVTDGIVPDRNGPTIFGSWKHRKILLDPCI